MSVVNAPAPEPVVVHEVVEPPLSPRRRAVSGIVLIVVGVLIVLAFGVGAQNPTATFGLAAPGNTPVEVSVPAAWTAGLLGLVVVGLGVWQLARGFHRRRMSLVTAVALAAFVLAFLCWAASGEGGTLPLLGLLQNTIFLAVPLVLGALGGILCERTGVINVAIEGQMLAGAFAGALFASVSQSL